METPDTLAELRNKLASLAAKWRFIDERYGIDPDAKRPAIRPVNLQRRPAPDDKAALDAYKAATIKAREIILEFGELARAIVQFFGRDNFPATLPDPPEFVFHPVKMQENAFGTKDPIEAGKLAIAWAAATRKEWSMGVRRDFGFVVERWAASMVHGFRAKDGSHGSWCVYQDVIPLALLAFDKLAAAHNATADARQDDGQFPNNGPVDLKGQRFARLHRRFMDASQRFPMLRYVAATGHNNCPGWPDVPDSAGYNHLGLKHKDWLDVMNKPPGTLFAPIGVEQWLLIEGQLWNGAFYGDGPNANPTDADHESLQRQHNELREAVEQFELLANETAGVLGPIPWKHALVEWPRKPEQSHRWLEAVCATVPIEPAGYYCFDIRRVPGNIFLASAILLEGLHAEAGKADTTAALSPLPDSLAELTGAQPPATAEATGQKERDQQAKNPADETGAATASGARLSRGQQNIVEVIRDAGHRLSQDEVLASLDAKHGVASIGTTKNYLAALVKFGVLTNRRDVDPPGYGLAEWG